MSTYTGRQLCIGMIHFKAGDTDGVSLEMDKWQKVFRHEGHRVYYCCGQPPMNHENCTVIPSLSYFSEAVRALDAGTFSTLEYYGSEETYEQALCEQVQTLTEDIGAWIKSTNLDVLIVENIWSVGLHPACAIALEQLVREHNISVLAHHHDFYWERVKPMQLTCKAAMQFVDRYLPPHLPHITHVVINTKAQQDLQERKGITATIIPNVFDFSQGPWQKDEYNADLRQVCGIEDNDILLLQATRVVRRKGIELAIDFAQSLQTHLEPFRGKMLYNGTRYGENSKVVLALAGSTEHDGPGYLAQLQEKARERQVILTYIGEKIGHTRATIHGKKQYSLWDSYVHADLVTYPSYWEGWGNQLLEAVRAKLPVVLFPYEIYRRDIRQAGFKMIELGNEEDLAWDARTLAMLPQAQIERAAKEAITVLFDRQARNDMVESNFKIGQEAFSLETLGTLLAPYTTAWSNTVW
ncbi:MAG: glycosyltransferase [Sphaerochaeta sp.]